MSRNSCQKENSKNELKKFLSWTIASQHGLFFDEKKIDEICKDVLYPKASSYTFTLVCGNFFPILKENKQSSIPGNGSIVLSNLFLRT